MANFKGIIIFKIVVKILKVLDKIIQENENNIIL